MSTFLNKQTEIKLRMESHARTANQSRIALKSVMKNCYLWYSNLGRGLSGKRLLPNRSLNGELPTTAF